MKLYKIYEYDEDLGFSYFAGTDTFKELTNILYDLFMYDDNNDIAFNIIIHEEEVEDES